VNIRWERIALATISVTILLAYLPGLGGNFLLDDFGTLSSLGEWGAINKFDKWLSFVTTAYTGPNGRVLAVASFTLNSSTWPADPFWFLLTNLIIHISNTILLFLLLKKILEISTLDKTHWLALVATLIWAVHPLQVSTVLYVVQRMAQLEFTFNVLSLIFYICAREYLSNGYQRKGLLFLFGSGMAGIAALYCKETAVLIPLQLAMLEILLNRIDSKITWPNRYWQIAIIYIPLAAFIFLFVRKVERYIGADLLAERRGFTMMERLYTEFRVVGDYLTYFFLPKVQTAGVFHDAYPLSRSLFQPISTLIWAIIHGLLIFFAIEMRKRLPVIALGILWFYGNHLLESTLIQLEIKYEHRNYLPSVGLALIVAYGLIKIPIAENFKKIITVLVLAALSLTTFARAELWGNPDKAVLVWMEENPLSPRAIENALLHYSQKPNSDGMVRALLAKGLALESQDPAILLKALSFDCTMVNSSQYSLESITQTLSQSDIIWQMGELLSGVLDSIHRGNCNQISKVGYQSLVNAVRTNKTYRKTRILWLLNDLDAKSEFLLGDKALALEKYNNIEYRNGMLGLKMNEALFLASNGFQKEAAEILEYAIVKAGPDENTLKPHAQDMLSRIKQDVN